jgi:uncharacterized protein (TIGR03067 family)
VIEFIGLALAYGLAVGAGNANLGALEVARLEGVWRFAGVEVDGVKQPNVPFETNKLIVLKDGRYVIVQGKRITRGVVKLDPTKAPKHYDVLITSGRNKGLTSPGIYELEGDTLHVFQTLRGKERPTALLSKPGTGSLLHVFKREQRDVTEVLTAVGRQELAGTWQAVSYALDGKKATDEEMKKVQLVIDAEGKTAATNEGKVFIASTTKIDLTAEPMAIDMAYTEGYIKDKTSFGIYKIEGEILTICRAAPGKPRPAEFGSEPGSGHTLMTYRRENTAAK